MRLIIALLSCVFLQSLSAQNTVTFQVNMNEYMGTYTDVNLNGNFNGWCGSCAQMTDDDSDGIYTIDVDLASGQYEYKFTIDGWTSQEEFTPGGPCTLTTGGFTNRVVTIEENTVLSPVCWNSCGDCGAAPSTADITFRVDMSEYTGAYTTVNLNGGFNGWCGACAEMTDTDSDGIYELTVNAPVATIEYKFTVDGWDDQENFTEGDPCTSTIDGFTNRTYTVTEESTLDVVCWGACEACDPNSITEFEELAMSISPNPSNGLVQLSIADELRAENGSVYVFTLEGKLVISTSLLSIQDGSLDLSSLSDGMYMIDIRSERYRSTERLSIQK